MLGVCLCLSVGCARTGVGDGDPPGFTDPVFIFFSVVVFG